jgi:transcriptional regulator with XRE-family HTH domain
MAGRPPAEPSRIGARIRAARLRKKLSLDEAADLANIDKSSWSRWETTEIDFRLSTLRRIAEVCGVSLARLVG